MAEQSKFWLFVSDKHSENKATGNFKGCFDALSEAAVLGAEVCKSEALSSGRIPDTVVIEVRGNKPVTEWKFALLSEEWITHELP